MSRVNYIFDTFTNFLSGLGVPGRDKLDCVAVRHDGLDAPAIGGLVSLDWIARKAITIPAHDATREWRSWQAKRDADREARRDRAAPAGAIEVATGADQGAAVRRLLHPDRRRRQDGKGA